MVAAFIGAGIIADYLNLTFGDDARRAIMIEGVVSFLNNLNLP